MVLESKNEGNVLTLSFNDEKTKNSISAIDWIEFRKQVKEFDESDLKYLVLSQVKWKLFLRRTTRREPQCTHG